MIEEMNQEDVNSTETTYKAIKDWREDERPRERLSNHGARFLSDSELLAILINSGTKNFSAIDVARKLLSNHNNLTRLASCDFSEFKKIKGLGQAKAITLAAAFELSRRIDAEPVKEKLVVKSPDDIANYYISRMRGERKEIFCIVLLSTANQIIREVIISQGSLNASIVHPREVFRIAITESAASVILVHNHPSGSLEPSKEDISLTNQLISAGKIIGIRILDHLIIAGENYTSFARIGLI